MKFGYENCRLCPRNCQINRLEGQKGFCRMDSRIFGARAALHMWEEPCISGRTGSGTVFFRDAPCGVCTARTERLPGPRSDGRFRWERLSQIFLELQAKQAANINLVTPTHYAPSILEAVKKARAEGLVIPIVYNCSGYESVEALKMLDGWIDIYLTDFKYMENETARQYSAAEDYPSGPKKP